MKIIDKNQKQNSVPMNAVDRIFGGTKVLGQDIIETTVTQSGRTIFEVPLVKIKARPVNNYAISGIDELAKSIHHTGLWQPIVLKRNQNPTDKEEYVIVAGERRYTAIKKLKEQADLEGNTAESKIYSSITAIILTPDDETKEEDIYRDTNDYARQLTNFERIMRLDPDSIDMSKESWQERYVEQCFGTDKLDDYRSGKLKIKGNLTDKSRYIVSLITEKEPDVDISDSTVRVYLNMLARTGETLRQAVLKGVIPLRDAQKALSWLSEDEQRMAVDAVGTPDYEEYLELGRELGEETKKSKKTDPKKKDVDSLISMVSSVTKKMYGIRKSLDRACEGLLYRSDMTPEQKDYVDKLRKLASMIGTVEKAERALSEKDN